MKIAVIRPNSSGWIFAAGSESSWSITLNRHNYEWWRKLVVQARENYGDGLVAALAATAALYDDAAWQQLVPGVELRHGIGCTLWDGANLIRISGGGREERDALAAGRAGSAGQRAVCIGRELTQMWQHIFIRLAEELSQERYGPQWPERVPQLVDCARPSSRRPPHEANRPPDPHPRPPPPPAEAAAEERPNQSRPRCRPASHEAARHTTLRRQGGRSLLAACYLITIRGHGVAAIAEPRLHGPQRHLLLGTSTGAASGARWAHSLACRLSCCSRPCRPRHLACCWSPYASAPARNYRHRRTRSCTATSWPSPVRCVCAACWCRQTGHQPASPTTSTTSHLIASAR
ncbi:MAG: hypothetical protein KatS3mg038_1478 [Candidatus Kapaibacterium sp.]|nr:MAG: hypothetical protein KatS3mg038_1478 [Candidatus Kapabacteria bacterium]